MPAHRKTCLKAIERADESLQRLAWMMLSLTTLQERRENHDNHGIQSQGVSVLFRTPSHNAAGEVAMSPKRRYMSNPALICMASPYHAPDSGGCMALRAHSAGSATRRTRLPPRVAHLGIPPQRHISRIRAATSAHRLAMGAFAPSNAPPDQARHSNRSRIPSGMNRLRGANT
jgi:hypothetical protein